MSENTDLMVAHSGLVAQAEMLGFPRDYIANVLNKLGPSVLELLVKLANDGFSVDFIRQALERLGPLMLELMVDALRVSHSVGFTGTLEEGEVVNFDNAVFTQLFQKFVQMLFDRYGDQLLQVVMELLAKILLKQ